MSSLRLLVFFIVALGSICISLGEVVEPSTKQKFQENVGGLSLAGVGVRVKKLGPVSAKVYAAGVYLNKGAATGALKKDIESAKSSSELEKSKSFANTLAKGNFDKNVVLKMARTVGSEKMVDALAESLKPRMAGGGGDALDQFQSILLKGLSNGAKNNMVLSFKASGGSMQVSIDGKSFGNISSKPLCDAFMGIYVDGKCVSPGLKKDIASNIFKWA